MLLSSSHHLLSIKKLTCQCDDMLKGSKSPDAAKRETNFIHHRETLIIQLLRHSPGWSRSLQTSCWDSAGRQSNCQQILKTKYFSPCFRNELFNKSDVVTRLKSWSSGGTLMLKEKQTDDLTWSLEWIDISDLPPWQLAKFKRDGEDGGAVSTNSSLQYREKNHFNQWNHSQDKQRRRDSW